MADAPPLRRFRLLPPGTHLGWTPYAWLTYLPTFLIEPVMRERVGRASAGYWAATALGLALFLATYFRGYWLRDRKLLPVIAIQAALGVCFAPVNTGSFVFFVYAAGFAAQLERSREALRLVAAVTLAGVLTAWAVQAPVYFWLGAAVITPLIGGVNLHYAQVDRSNVRLRMAQEEIEQLAATAERERIARDLHDVLGHTLSLIVLKAELASRLAERDPPRAAREIRDVEQVARAALQEVREAIRGYRATLEDEAARARSLLGVAKIRADIEVGAASLDRAREEVLALALREAVTNVVRHSGASRCRARVTRAAGACALVVEDDGRGGAAPEGSGLRGMRERVEALGGTVARDGRRGTRLTITLPLGTEGPGPRTGAAAGAHPRAGGPPPNAKMAPTDPDGIIEPTPAESPLRSRARRPRSP